MDVKKYLDMTIQAILLVTLAMLIALTVVTLTSCGAVSPPPPQGKKQEVVFWVPQPQGAYGCPDARRPGFRPGPQALWCDVFAPDKIRLGSIKVKARQFYCSVPDGYVRCEDANGQPVWTETRAMCTFEGAVPECLALEPPDPM